MSPAEKNCCGAGWAPAALYASSAKLLLPPLPPPVTHAGACSYLWVPSMFGISDFFLFAAEMLRAPMQHPRQQHARIMRPPMKYSGCVENRSAILSKVSAGEGEGAGVGAIVGPGMLGRAERNEFL